jgi:hypothetical protein
MRRTLFIVRHLDRAAADEFADDGVARGGSKILLTGVHGGNGRVGGGRKRGIMGVDND